MAAHKEVLVADVWDFSRAEGGWSLVFVRDFNDWEIEEVERLLQTWANLYSVDKIDSLMDF